MPVAQFLAFADELRAAGAPTTARVRFDRDSSSCAEQLSCSWTEDAPEPPRFVIENGTPAAPEEFALLRHAAGLTQQAVGDAIGMSRSSIASLEAGRQDVPLSKLRAYAELVGAQLVLAGEIAP